jgi:hypothetical protein
MRPVFVLVFLEEIEDTKKTFRSYLTFSWSANLRENANLVNRPYLVNMLTRGIDKNVLT